MFELLYLMCSPLIHHDTINALVATESYYNPYAIAQIKGNKTFNINSDDEFTNTMRILSENNNLYFIYNNKKYDVIDDENINYDKDTLKIYAEWGNKSFMPTSEDEAKTLINELNFKNANYSIGLGQINRSNFSKYQVKGEDLLNSCKNLKIAQSILLDCFKSSPNQKVSEALSCYYSGNHNYGFVKENIGNSYLQRIVKNINTIPVVPNITTEINFINKKTEEVNKYNRNQNSNKKVISKTNLINIRSIPNNMKIVNK